MFGELIINLFFSNLPIVGVFVIVLASVVGIIKMLFR